MKDQEDRCRRRSFLGLIAAGACGLVPPRAGLAGEENIGRQPTLLVAGPEQSETGAWARVLEPVIASSPAMAGKLRLRFVGGQDGVTGANQFEAWTSSGEQDALLMPGAAALAWVAGDSRVRFDATRLIPLFASVSPGLLMTRIRPPGARAALRVACSAAAEPGVAGYLGLDLLGIGAVPARAGPDCMESLRAGTVDAAFLRGADVPGQRRAVEQLGFSALFAVGDGQDGLERNPALADVATLSERLASVPTARSELVAAWRAVAAASVLDVTLALPALSIPAGVARWRRACATSVASPDIEDLAAARTLRLLTGSASAGALARLEADAAAQVALRQWFAGRLHWRPT